MHIFAGSQTMGMNVQAGLVALLYQKSLRLRPAQVSPCMRAACRASCCLHYRVAHREHGPAGAARASRRGGSPQPHVGRCRAVRAAAARLVAATARCSPSCRRRSPLPPMQLRPLRLCPGVTAHSPVSLCQLTVAAAFSIGIAAVNQVSPPPTAPRVNNCLSFFHFLWTAPVEIGVALALAWGQVRRRRRRRHRPPVGRCRPLADRLPRLHRSGARCGRAGRDAAALPRADAPWQPDWDGTQSGGQAHRCPVRGPGNPIRDSSCCCHPLTGVPRLRPGPRRVRAMGEVLAGIKVSAPARPTAPSTGLLLDSAPAHSGRAH